MTFHLHMHNDSVPQPEPGKFPPIDPMWSPPDPFKASPAIHTPTNKLSWAELWTRRRSYHASATSNASIAVKQFDDVSTAPSEGGLGEDPPPVNNISAGDIHLAAWQDFYYGYIFVSKVGCATTACKLTCMVSVSLFICTCVCGCRLKLQTRFVWDSGLGATTWTISTEQRDTRV